SDVCSSDLSTVEFGVELGVEAVNLAVSAELNQLDGARISWLQTHSCASRNIKALALGRLAGKLQVSIRLGKMEVGSDRSVAASLVCYLEVACFFALVDMNFFRGVEDEFTGSRAIVLLCDVVLADRVVASIQLGSVGECGLDLHGGDHLWHAFHDFFTRQVGDTFAHQLCDGLAVACAFEQFCGDIRLCFGVVEL